MTKLHLHVIPINGIAETYTNYSPTMLHNTIKSFCQYRRSKRKEDWYFIFSGNKIARVEYPIILSELKRLDSRKLFDLLHDYSLWNTWLDNVHHRHKLAYSGVPTNRNLE